MIGQCSLELLESALAGSLLADAEASLCRHLDECEECSAAMERMAGGAAWCQEAAALLVEDELDEAVPSHEEWSEVDFTVEHLEPSDEPGVLGRLGGYDVLEIIGRGGMGIVLKGFDRELKRCVAIKVLAPHLAHSSLAKKRFAREAQAAAAVVHPHVLAIHHVQASGRLPFLVMPLVAGESLAERLAKQGTLELKEILRIGIQAAAGLAAAHDQGLVHRDVKPANILLEMGVERAVLTDFGLARAADDVSMTRWGIIAGTPQYMSPEQAKGEPLDGRSDLFSMGCVMYEMATGVSPFRTESAMATMRRLVDESPQALASLNPELPPWFIAIVERLLEKDPARRFGSAKEVSELLEGCLAHVQQPASVPLPAAIAKPVTKLDSGRRRSRFKGVIAMLGLMGTVLLGAFGWVQSEPPDIAGQWKGEDWGTVILKQTSPGEYTGTYTDTFGKTPGEIYLKWSRIERRFNGTWGEGKSLAFSPDGKWLADSTDRFGELSVRLVNDEIRGALTTDAKSKINPATPRLADLTWTRGAAMPVVAKASSKSPAKDAKQDKQAVPMEQYTGQVSGAFATSEGNFATFNFAMDERSYLQYQRLLRQGAVGGPGSPLRIRLQDEDGFSHQGTLDRFANEVNPKTGAVEVRGFLPDPGRLLIHGMTLWIQMPFGLADNKDPTKAAGNARKAPPAPKPRQDQHRIEVTYPPGDASKAPPAQKPAPTVLGPKAFRDGDVIEITDVHATSPKLEQGDSLTICGRFRLSSQDLGQLCLFVTQAKGDGGDEVDLGQTIQVKRGRGDFELKTTIRHRGYLHLTFYDKSGNPFGGVYFGTAAQMKEIEGWSLDYYLQGKDAPGRSRGIGKKSVDANWVYGPEIAVLWSDSNLGNGALRRDALRLDDGHLFNLPKKDVSHEEQEKWLNESKVNFAIDYLKETDQWEMKLRNVKIAELPNKSWESLSAKELQERFAKLEWKKVTNAEAQQKEKGFYCVKFLEGMRPPMTFAFETSDGHRGVLQFKSATRRAAGPSIALIHYKPIQLSDTPANLKGDGGKTNPNSLPQQMYRLQTKNCVGALAYSPDGKTLALGGNPETVGLFEAKTGKAIATLKLYTKDEEAILAAAKNGPWQENTEVLALAFSADSRVLAVGTSFGQVKLFDVQTGALLGALDDVDRHAKKEKPLHKFLELRLAHGRIWAIAFSPDGSLLATCGDPIDYDRDGISRTGLGPSAGLLKLWDAKTGDLKKDLKDQHFAQVTYVAFSPDGKVLASAGPGTGVKLWDPLVGKVTKELASPRRNLGGGTPTCFSFSPDGKRLAMGFMQYDKSTDVTSGSINIVYPASGILDLSWRVPCSVRPVLFSPDGTTVAAFSAKSTLTLWDSSTGLPKREIRQTEKPASHRWECFAFAPKGNVLAIGGIDTKHGGYVEVWDLDGAASESKKTSEAPSRQSPRIGPVIERVLNDPQETREKCAINLESGELISIPASITLDRQIWTQANSPAQREAMAWARNKHVDAVAFFTIGKDKLKKYGLLGPDLIAIPVGNDDILMLLKREERRLLQTHGENDSRVTAIRQRMNLIRKASEMLLPLKLEEAELLDTHGELHPKIIAIRQRMKIIREHYGVANDVWDEITAAQVAEELARRTKEWGFIPEVAELTSDGKATATYLIQTRAGRMGILQITGINENPRGVKIRYTLVEGKKAAAGKDSQKEAER